MSDNVQIVGRQVTIKSLTTRPVFITLNSKETLRIPSGDEVSGVLSSELAGNPDVAKLLRLQLIALKARVDTDEEVAARSKKAHERKK